MRQRRPCCQRRRPPIPRRRGDRPVARALQLASCKTSWPRLVWLSGAASLVSPARAMRELRRRAVLTSSVLSGLPPMPQSPLCTSSTTTQVTPRMFSPSVETIVSVRDRSAPPASRTRKRSSATAKSRRRFNPHRYVTIRIVSNLMTSSGRPILGVVLRMIGTSVTVITFEAWMARRTASVAMTTFRPGVRGWPGRGS